MSNYEDAGSGPGIVFLHGFPFNRSMWREQIEFLSERGYRTVAPDLRGLGANVTETSAGEATSDNHRIKSVPPATMEDMACDVAALMDQLGINHVILCGLSMGCYVALEFIHLFPERIRALILCGPRAQGPDEAEKQSREAQALRALLDGMDFAVESISMMLLAKRTVIEKPDVVARVREMVLSTNPKGAAAAQRGMAERRDYSDELTNISVPTLIVAGREDGVRKPEDAEFIHQQIKNARLEVLDDAGHLMNMEQPAEFNEKLAEFLKLIH